MFDIPKRPVNNMIYTFLMGWDAEGDIVQSFSAMKSEGDEFESVRCALKIWTDLSERNGLSFINETLEDISSRVDIEIDSQKVAVEILHLLGTSAPRITSVSLIEAVEVDEGGMAHRIEPARDLIESMVYLSEREESVL